MISVSKASDILSCPRKFYLGRLLRIKRNPIYFAVGSAYGRAISHIDLGFDYDIDLEEDCQGDFTAYAKLLGILHAWVTFRREKPSHEVVRTPWLRESKAEVFLESGAKVLGFLDGISIDQKTILEWKYAMQPYSKLVHPKAGLGVLRRQPKSRATDSRNCEEVYAPHEGWRNRVRISG